MSHIMLLLTVLSSIMQLHNKDTREDFAGFLVRFSVDSTYQKSRVSFPLEFNSFDRNDKKKRSTILEVEFVRLKVLEPASSFFTDISYDFNEIPKDTNERILSFIGIETGVNVKLYFRRFKGLWFLIRIDDFST